MRTPKACDLRQRRSSFGADGRLRYGKVGVVRISTLQMHILPHSCRHRLRLESCHPACRSFRNVRWGVALHCRVAHITSRGGLLSPFSSKRRVRKRERPTHSCTSVREAWRWASCCWCGGKEQFIDLDRDRVGPSSKQGDRDRVGPSTKQGARPFGYPLPYLSRLPPASLSLSLSLSLLICAMTVATRSLSN